MSRLAHFLCLPLFIVSMFAWADPALLPIKASTRAADSVIDFRLWKSRILYREKIGLLKVSSYSTELVYDDEINRSLPMVLKEVFSDLAGQQGYTVKKDLSASDQADVSERIATPDYVLGASLLDMQMNARSHPNGSMSGSLRFKIKWEMYSENEQAVVFNKITENAVEVDSEAAVRAEVFYAKAMLAAATSLLADPAFSTALEGSIPPAVPLAPIRLAALLPAPPSGKGQFARDMKALTAAAATIKTKTHSGSGFYIGESGYLLTNWHVVQNARYVRVVNADGRQVIGEVLRTNPGRDVVLIKADAVSPHVLPLSSTLPAEGAQVSAIGSPHGEAFSGTVSRGILSTPRIVKGRKFLQSDVVISPGSSGGPLIDANGNVVGISVQGYVNEKGLNFFIPIDEALSSLAVETR